MILVFSVKRFPIIAMTNITLGEVLAVTSLIRYFLLRIGLITAGFVDLFIYFLYVYIG